MNHIRFLIDVNLPQYFNFFHSPEFKHILEIDGKMSDEAIWSYAKEHQLIILSRDSDFYFKCLKDPSVKVIHFALGNIRLKELHAFFRDYWNQVLTHIEEAILIQVTREEIKIIL